MNTIIVVDDNRDTTEIIKTTLEAKGYSAICTHSGAELFSQMEKVKPDLIVLDIMMPQMDGLEVLRRLRSASETSSIPVIILTAKVEYDDVLKGYQEGAYYYITKPFTSTQLLRGINLILGRS